jgi:hypothetical protein
MPVNIIVTPASALFTLFLFALIVLTVILLRPVADSPGLIVLRVLLFALFSLQPSLLTILAAHFSPRLEVSGTLATRPAWTSSYRANVTLATSDGGSVTLSVPEIAARQITKDEPVEVTYLAWTKQAVSIRDSSRDVDLQERLLGFEAESLLEQYVAGVVIFGAGMLCFLGIRRLNAKPATIDLTAARRS